jgi:galactose mutarotase-like enzyme
LTADFSIEENNIYMIYTITNLSTEIMFFSIANHIGLNIPFYEDSRREDLVIKTSGKKRETIILTGGLQMNMNKFH